MELYDMNKPDEVEECLKGKLDVCCGIITYGAIKDTDQILEFIKYHCQNSRLVYIRRAFEKLSIVNTAKLETLNLFENFRKTTNQNTKDLLKTIKNLKSANKQLNEKIAGLVSGLNKDQNHANKERNQLIRKGKKRSKIMDRGFADKNEAMYSL